MLSQKSNAQISLKINIVSQPIWGPEGYDYVEYYYLPEIDVYYNVARHRYIYMSHNQWIVSLQLPPHYRSFDVYHARKVIINEQRPYLRHDHFKQKYAHSNDYSNQRSIRDSNDEKYYKNKHHPKHNNWKIAKKNSHNKGRQNKHSKHKK
ncbi:MAG: hypothetical protein JXR51_02260 [Bacteroidales bacterium]|nr:hypothetical protein [Bacteroidales bacterium]